MLVREEGVHRDLANLSGRLSDAYCILLWPAVESEVYGIEHTDCMLPPPGTSGSEHVRDIPGVQMLPSIHHTIITSQLSLSKLDIA